MSSFIPDEKVEEVRERCNIVEVVSGYVSLKKAGRNFVGLCPFHSEKTPSFTVNEEKGIFHCFGCGTGGNVFSFLTRIEGRSFPEVVRELAEKEGVELPRQDASPAYNKERERVSREKDKLLGVNEEAAVFYQNLLMKSAEGEDARSYLKGRGIDSEIAKEWRLGYGGREWSTFSNRLKSSDSIKTAEKAGLILERKKGGHYDRFRKRLIFPICDLKGKVVAFGGRILDGDGPKYMNSPESPIYTKGKLLYGLNVAKEGIRTEGEAILVEGYMDLLSLYGAGIRNVAGTLGTALTVSQALLLKRFCKKVILLFDSDEAGVKAALRAFDILSGEGVAALVLTLPEGEDPDSFVTKEGAEALREKIKDAVPALDFFLGEKMKGRDISSPAEAAAVIHEVNPFLKRIKDPVERSLAVKKVAERMAVDEEILLDALKSGKRQKAQVKAVKAPRRKRSKVLY